MVKFSVFVASPGDVKEERDLLKKVILEVNSTHGQPLGYELNLLRWEENAYPSAGAPQEVINSIIPEYDIFIGIMWKRFGTPTTVAGSGTEEEYRIAFKKWETNHDLAIMFYFCNKPFTPNLEEFDQVKKVLEFKKEIETKSLIWVYENPVGFEAEIRKHLCLRMNDIMKKKNTPRGVFSGPDKDSIKILKELFPRMTPDLQKAFKVAYNENRMAGDGGIKTKDLFAALVRNPSEDLDNVFKKLPPKALPEPTEGTLVEKSYILNENPWLSHCVSSSLKRMSKILPVGKQLTALDIFIDIARNGTGESVQLLRQHNIGPAEIQDILKQENLHVLESK